MSPFVHIFLGHERDRFEITPVISSNVEYVAVALCGRLWGTFLGHLKENLDKFQGKQVLSHSFPKMKSNSVAGLTVLPCCVWWVFADLAKQWRKIVGGFLRSEKLIFLLFC